MRYGDSRGGSWMPGCRWPAGSSDHEPDDRHHLRAGQFELAEVITNGGDGAAGHDCHGPDLALAAGEHPRQVQRAVDVSRPNTVAASCHTCAARGSIVGAATGFAGTKVLSFTLRLPYTQQLCNRLTVVWVSGLPMPATVEGRAGRQRCPCVVVTRAAPGAHLTATDHHRPCRSSGPSSVGCCFVWRRDGQPDMSRPRRRVHDRLPRYRHCRADLHRPGPSMLARQSARSPEASPRVIPHGASSASVVTAPAPRWHVVQLGSRRLITNAATAAMVAAMTARRTQGAAAGPGTF